LIIFDFDGTIADSFETFITVTNRMAQEFGYPTVQPQDIPRFRQMSSRQIIQEAGLSKFKLPFFLARFRRDVAQQVGDLKLFPEMLQTLQVLRAEDYDLGIVTSNAQGHVEQFLKAQQVADLFAFISGDQPLFGKARVLKRLIRRYRLNPQDVIYVGDETRDIEAAQAIGIRVIAVSWGFNALEVLSRHQPDAIAHTPKELHQAIHRLTGVM
jgi:phosphoglycolate phosphatase